MRSMLLLIAATLLLGELGVGAGHRADDIRKRRRQEQRSCHGALGREFIVREDDAAREVLRVSAATEPLQIAVLVDTSQAIEEHLLDLRTALRAFFKQMGGKHDIALIGLGERPTVLSDYTRDVARLEKSIGSVFARSGSGTYILDAIVEATNGMRRRKAARPHIIVYGARGPEFSERYHESRHRRAARVRSDAAYAHAQQTRCGDGQPRGTGARKDGGGWHESSPAAAAKIC